MATAECVQRSTCRHKSSDNLPNSARPAAHPTAVSPSTGLLERLDSIHPPHPRHPNPHSPSRDTHDPLPRFPSIGSDQQRWMQYPRGRHPWRFAYAGPRGAPRHRHGAAIRKPSQKPPTEGHLLWSATGQEAIRRWPMTDICSVSPDTMYR